MLQHRQMLGRLRKSRYDSEDILDYLENKATKAIYITAKHVVYVNLERQSVRWALSLRHLFSVTTAGEIQSSQAAHSFRQSFILTRPGSSLGILVTQSDNAPEYCKSKPTG